MQFYSIIARFFKMLIFLILSLYSTLLSFPETLEVVA
jgi:hypothetical protein